MFNNLQVFLIISTILFILGILAILTRKNAISILMGIELILNSAGLNFVAFSKFSSGNLNGQIFALFIILLAAAEAAVALAIFLGLYRQRKTVFVDQASELKQ
ncbi:MAG: NADH-quinone oxidoreductase subunit NuoK [bacterium]|nr:NADH-quinone oxidoreductase subunit NuoK [bacterium]